MSVVKQNFVDFESQTPLSEIIGTLKEQEKQAAIIFKNNKYLGTLEKQKLLRSNIDLHNTHAENCVQRTPIINESTSIIKALGCFCGGSTDYIPFEQDKKIIGVVNILDLMKLAADLPETAKLKVGDIKLNKPPRLNSDDVLASALHILREHHLDSVPIFEQGELTSVLNYKDVIRKMLNWSPKRNVSAKFNQELRSKGAQVETSSLGDVPIKDLATNEGLIAVTSKTSLKETLQVMAENNFTNILVLDGGNYKGMLTTHNILLTIAKLNKTDNFSLYFVGLNKVNLTEHQEQALHDIAEKEALKLQRKVKEPFSIAVHLKEINKEGKQSIYNVHLKIEINGKIHTSEKEGWDLETALHKSFNIINF